MSDSRYQVIGVMSGTSLDGLDVALCQFVGDENWEFELVHAESYPFSEGLMNQLRDAPFQSVQSLKRTELTFDQFTIEAVNQFCADFGIDKSQVDALSTHGHTVLHTPDSGITFQMSNLARVAVATGLKTIGDFRSADVALGGQGAPLVPIGDEYLFGEYAACVNLGGFANLSLQKDDQRVAWDIVPVNFVMNRLAKQMGKHYDEGGEAARSGNVIPSLLTQLEELPFYAQSAPKSLGWEWIESNLSFFFGAEYAAKDKLRTYSTHVAERISADLNVISGDVLFTGGGVFNDFLMEQIRSKMKGNCVVPDRKIIEFKEAILFAFLGALRLEGKVNVLSSVTGTKKDHVSGGIFLP